MAYTILKVHRTGPEEFPTRPLGLERVSPVPGPLLPSPASETPTRVEEQASPGPATQPEPPGPRPGQAMVQLSPQRWSSLPTLPVQQDGAGRQPPDIVGFKTKNGVPFPSAPAWATPEAPRRTRPWSTPGTPITGFPQTPRDDTVGPRTPFLPRGHCSSCPSLGSDGHSQGRAREALSPLPCTGPGPSALRVHGAARCSWASGAERGGEGGGPEARRLWPAVTVPCLILLSLLEGGSPRTGHQPLTQRDLGWPGPGLCGGRGDSSPPDRKVSQGKARTLGSEPLFAVASSIKCCCVKMHGRLVSASPGALCIGTTRPEDQIAARRQTHTHPKPNKRRNPPIVVRQQPDGYRHDAGVPERGEARALQGRKPTPTQAGPSLVEDVIWAKECKRGDQGQVAAARARLARIGRAGPGGGPRKAEPEVPPRAAGASGVVAGAGSRSPPPGGLGSRDRRPRASAGGAARAPSSRGHRGSPPQGPTSSPGHRGHRPRGPQLPQSPGVTAPGAPSSRGHRGSPPQGPTSSPSHRGHRPRGPPAPPVTGVTAPGAHQLPRSPGSPPQGPPAPAVTGGHRPRGPPAPPVTGVTAPGAPSSRGHRGSPPQGPPAPAVTGGHRPRGPPAPPVTGVTAPGAPSSRSHRGSPPQGPPAPAVTGGHRPRGPPAPPVTGVTAPGAHQLPRSPGSLPQGPTSSLGHRGHRPRGPPAPPVTGVTAPGAHQLPQSPGSPPQGPTSSPGHRGHRPRGPPAP
ncbi:basic proline-rich protein-like [Canis lupus dingo]|uniref:basic proline-rich protein-like n=1 Tax=Canis lupus dingo TaxID=286419 RepID=UPI0020C4B090|nr:basic proline-rich protein-like [Canis lupus dingo]